MAEPTLDVTVCDGKYRYIVHADYRAEALRYDAPWRDCTGDGLILALASELAEARARLAALESRDG